ncbi:DNA-binding response regulator, OmpR family, contains REC and winged-helix (wHTH) domain [Ruminococcus sp. YE71]|uniref:response regulator transcription factor n=1 Tax=unclassified Ruminococcus TaxID=2608920 RepID=UPI00088F0069|nr:MULTISPECIES: response regulator transcription factor [unclassified Ruminococcus]SDA09955.1 DNA-binding response regulator, OmpR family, contains REC and winged-helix (wHTH) domain [Ruminococcus sp. YE78]SFW11212.1 DNA-binding response regulator, OmpR family, contains REC and winged-helix (wHTH) domain [Ruminococcus sp. YE71]
MDILIIEDDKDMAALLTDFLRAENYTVSAADCGRRGVELYQRYGAKLVVLDVNLPDITGFEVCSKIRDTADTPILIVSARTSKEDKLSGLELGADDYIEKPYDIDIMLAKIRGIFRRRYSQDTITDDDITLNRADKTAVIKGQKTELTAKEFDLLLLFIENKGKVLKKEYLLNAVWGSDSLSEPQTLNVHISRLRSRLEADPRKPQRLLTVWGVGYKFV